MLMNLGCLAAAFGLPLVFLTALGLAGAAATGAGAGVDMALDFWFFFLFEIFKISYIIKNIN